MKDMLAFEGRRTLRERLRSVAMSVFPEEFCSAEMEDPWREESFLKCLGSTSEVRFGY